MCGIKAFVLVGRIVKPYGLHGEIKVVSLTDWPEQFREFQMNIVIIKDQEKMNKPDKQGKRL